MLHYKVRVFSVMIVKRKPRQSRMNLHSCIRRGFLFEETSKDKSLF